MNRAPTHYQLLNVSSTATADQIRSAYLRVMKRHHPDVVGGRSDAPDFLPLINDVYKSLSDPAKRAAYDAQLAAEERARRSAWATDLPGRSRWRSETALGRLPARTAAGGLAAILFVVLLAVWGGAVAIAPEGERSLEPVRALESTPHWLKPLAPSAPFNAWRSPSRSAISRYAHIGANLAEEQAAERSKSCFARARVLPTLGAAQLCVVLDDAFLYTHGTPRFSLSPYFNEVVVDLRHSSALDVTPGHPLLRHLWQATFAALMTELHATAPERGSTVNPERPMQAGVEIQTADPSESPHPLQNGTKNAHYRK